MEKTDKVRIVAPNTDITFSIKGLSAIPCTGEKNIPDGEIYSAPVKSYDVQINGRSLKAVPTSSIFTEDEFLTCKSECKERFKLYTEIEDCIKRYCGE